MIYQANFQLKEWTILTLTHWFFFENSHFLHLHWYSYPMSFPSHHFAFLSQSHDGRLQVFVCDVTQVPQGSLGKFDAAFDWGAYTAIRPADRQKWDFQYLMTIYFVNWSVNGWSVMVRNIPFNSVFFFFLHRGEDWVGLKSQQKKRKKGENFLIASP